MSICALFLRQQRLQSKFFNVQQEEFPSAILEEGCIDAQWHLIGQIKNSEEYLKYKKLSDFMLLILTIPYSNAVYEQVFSQITKITTHFSSLIRNEIIENLLICKPGQQSPCVEQIFDYNILKKAKPATRSVVKMKQFK